MDHHGSLQSTLSADEILRMGPHGFAFVAHDDSMSGVGIRQGDIIIGDRTPNTQPGAIVVALIDGESVIRRLVREGDRLLLVSENLNHLEQTPASEVVIQGSIHTLVHRLA